jgi:hypothetical protein
MDVITNILRSLDRDGRRMLGLLLMIDVVLIFLHATHSYIGIPKSGMFSIEWEMGHGEVFQYIKESWIASLLILRSASPLALSPALRGLNLVWGLLFGYLLLDDSIKIHESLGTLLAKVTGLSAWLGEGDRASSIGEIVINLMIATVFFGGIFWAYRHCGKADRRISGNLTRLLLALVVFGVGVDALHGIIGGSYPVRVAWSILEDGGEMIVMSLIFSYVFQLPPIAPELRAPLDDRVVSESLNR